MPLVSLASSHASTSSLHNMYNGIFKMSYIADKPAKSKETARHHITTELLQTEKNFVNILQIIIHVCLCGVSVCALRIVLIIVYSSDIQRTVGSIRSWCKLDS